MQITRAVAPQPDLVEVVQSKRLCQRRVRRQRSLVAEVDLLWIGRGSCGDSSIHTHTVGTGNRSHGRDPVSRAVHATATTTTAATTTATIAEPPACHHRRQIRHVHV